MKVTRGTYGSILAAAVVLGSLPESATAAEAATCAEKYYACINETEEIEGFLERTWAEQKCNAAWYQCVKNQAFGA